MESKRKWKIGDRVVYIQRIWVVVRECVDTDTAWIIAYPDTKQEFGWINERLGRKLTPLEELL